LQDECKFGNKLFRNSFKENWMRNRVAKMYVSILFSKQKIKACRNNPTGLVSAYPAQLKKLLLPVFL
jgi:hypothetical protein